MKVYLAGPMRGHANFNFPAFHEAEELLKSQGHEVFSPARADMERHGADISASNPFGDEDLAGTEHGFDLRVALGIDLAWICAHAEAIALMPGWEKSKGAKAEKATADALDLAVIHL
jgi:hypothetical protein